MKDHESSDDDIFSGIEKNWTKEELSKEIDELAYHPLFAKNTDGFQDSPEFLALQNLLYSEDDHTLAGNFCDQAAEILKNQYTNAPDELARKYFLQKALEKINEAIPLEKSDKALMLRLLSNRSFVNGKLSDVKREFWQGDRRLRQCAETRPWLYQSILQKSPSQDGPGKI